MQLKTPGGKGGQAGPLVADAPRVLLRPEIRVILCPMDTLPIPNYIILRTVFNQENPGVLVFLDMERW